MTELRSFPGFCFYYRRFVEGFAKIAHPLNELLKSEDEDDDPDRTKPVRPAGGARKTREFIGQSTVPECSFRQLK